MQCNSIGGGSMEQLSLPDFPFSLLVLAPFTSVSKGDTACLPLAVDPLDINQALAALAPSCFISLDSDLCPSGGMNLQFHKTADFTPDGLVRSQPYLRDLMAADQFCRQAAQDALSRGELMEGLRKWPELPELPAVQETKKTESENVLDNLLSMVDLPGVQASGAKTAATAPGSYGELALRIVEIIFSDPNFRLMESCWQGLRFTGSYLDGAGRLFILPVLPEDLILRLDELKASIIASPPSLLLIDQAFTDSPASMHILDQLAQFAREMLVPALAWVNAPFFQINSWDELDRLSFLPHHLDDGSFAEYRRLQQSDQGRWLALTCNRFLNRFSYGPENNPRLLPFRETRPPWLSPIWAAAALMASAVRQTGWPSGISSPHRLLDDLALHMGNSSDPSPLEIRLSADRSDQFVRCGIIPLTGAKGADSAFLAGDVMVSPDVSLSYQALVSRVSHFVLWCRDHWQGPMAPDELAEQLRLAFRLFAEKECTSSAGRLTVECSDGEAGIQVSFRWLPSRQILPVEQEIVLEFVW